MHTKQRPQRPFQPSIKTNLAFLLAAVLILLIAAFMRITRIDGVPPGPFYDDAANGIIAQSIAYGNSHPVFTLAFTGREPLYHYITAILMRLIGNDLWALRLSSFYLGMIVVAGIIAIAKEFFYHQPRRLWLSLLVGTLTATTFWPVSHARFGMRAISFTFTITLLLWSLLRLIRRKKLWDAILAGIWTGATAYTYTANRIVPIALILILLWLIIGKNKQIDLKNIAIMSLTALIIFLPFGLFLIKHPEIITHRATQVATISADLTIGQSIWTILNGIIVALGAFGFKGDPLLYLNVPDRPVFNVVIATFFYLGLIITLIRIFSKHAQAKLYGVIAIWFGVMLLPGALTTEPFHSLRSLGVLPVAMLLPVIGLEALLELVKKQWSITLPQWAYGGLLAVLLIGMTVETYNAYFNQWTADPNLYSLREGDIADLGRWFNDHDTGEEPIYIVSFHYEHPTMAFMADDYGRMKWAALSHTVVFPPIGEAAYIGVPQSTIGTGDWNWIEAQLSAAELLDDPLRPDGRPAYYVYHLDPDSPRPQPANPKEINYANYIQLLGYDPLAYQQNLLKAALYWEVLGQPSVTDYGLVVRLVDEWGFRWAEKGVFNYPPGQWEPGEIIAHEVVIERPAGLPPGHYMLELEWFSQGTGERLPVTTGGIYGYAGPVDVNASTLDNLPAIQYPVGETVGSLELLGYDRETTERYAGDVLRLALHWQATKQSDTDQLIRLVLQDENGEQFELSTDHPVHGTYPTSQWAAGEIITDRYAIRLDPGLPEGTYTLWLDAEPRINLGDLTVYQSDRLFEAPPVQHDQMANFGDTVRLLGYDLDGTAQPGDLIPLRLVWQAIQPPEDSYSVFIHLVNENGEIVAQHDGIPQGDYALYRWIEGEVVIDDIVIQIPGDLPTGDYRLRVGLYKPDSGERLPILESSGEAGSDLIWLDTPITVR